MRRALLDLGFFALLACGPFEASAALVVPHTVETLNDAADLVVRGRVGAQWARWDEAHRRIWTFTEIEVLEDLRGRKDALDVVRLRTLGGTVGGVSMQMSGAPELRSGEEFVLFLRGGPSGDYGIVGLSQGAFRLDRSSDIVIAVPLLEGLAFVPLRAEQVDQTRVVQMALAELRRAVADPAASSAPEVPASPAVPAAPDTPRTVSP